MVYDLTIVGGGPAGVAAGVYASRKRLKTLFITDSFGGQSSVSEDIQNWIGTVSISGFDLGENLKKHLSAYAGDTVTIQEGQCVEHVTKNEDGTFTLKTQDGELHTSKTILITTGSTRRKLDIPGAKEFDNKGLTYCASCDGPLFTDKSVAIIGGGNAAFESAAQLLAYVKDVTLLNRSQAFRADPVTVEKVLSHRNITALMNTAPVEIKGNDFVNTLVYKNTETGEVTEKPVEGIFVEIGLIPTTWFVKDAIELNEFKQIKIDPRTQRTTTPGIWAAGDATDTLYHQNNIAAGDAVRALEDIYISLHTK